MAIPLDAEDVQSDGDLYKTLGLLKGKDSSEEDIKKSYRRLALRHHPDKLARQDLDAEGRRKATEEFQAINLAYTVLSDAKKRARYDATGALDAPGFGDADDAFDWAQYFKSLWTGEVSARSIREFEKKYKGSTDEKDDLFEAYKQGEGSMDYILETVPCSSVDDEPRFIEIIQQALKDSTLASFPKWSASVKDAKARKRRQREAAKEAKEAEAYAKELGLDGALGNEKGDPHGPSGLELLIKKRAQERESQSDAFFDSLASKYGPKPKGKKQKR